VKEEKMLLAMKEEEEELGRLRADIENEEELQRRKQLEAFERGRVDLRYNEENKKIKDSEANISKVCAFLHCIYFCPLCPLCISILFISLLAVL
jgi:hypothetical protein